MDHVGCVREVVNLATRQRSTVYKLDEKTKTSEAINSSERDSMTQLLLLQKQMQPFRHNTREKRSALLFNLRFTLPVIEEAHVVPWRILSIEWLLLILHFLFVSHFNLESREMVTQQNKSRNKSTPNWNNYLGWRHRYTGALCQSCAFGFWSRANAW